MYVERFARVALVRIEEELVFVAPEHDRHCSDLAPIELPINFRGSDVRFPFPAYTQAAALSNSRNGRSNDGAFTPPPESPRAKH